jgi:hypothetical protein
MSKILAILLSLLSFLSFGFSQDFPNDSSRRAYQKIIPPLDSIVRFIPDSLKNKNADTLSIMQDESKSKKGSLDTLVSVKGKDSISLDMKSQIMKIYGDAILNYKKQQLTANMIVLNLKESSLQAYPKYDSNKISDFPVFNDNGEEFYGKIINYNFKTQKGLIDLGETKMTNGFYFGDKIKKVSEKELYVSDGCYTTCDAPQPHYYFGSPKMKVVTQDKIFVDPLILYVEDMPVFLVPFGFYLPNKTGRQSGLIVPGYFFSNDRGVVLENLGFYWAASDYWDTQFAVNFYSKGGAIFKNSSRVIVGDYLNSDYTLQYGKTRTNPNNPYTTNWSLVGDYNQAFNPMEKISGSFNFSSQDFNRNTETNLNDRITQNISSNISYSRSFENGTSLSLSYQRNQNIITNEYSQVIPLTYSIPNLYPFKQISSIPKDSWVRDISFNLNTTANYSTNYARFYSTKLVDTNVVPDTLFKTTENKYISYTPNLSISPKLGYFTISPSISFGANTFFRYLTKQFNPIDSTIENIYTRGVFWEYWYSLNLSISTRLYGMIDSKHKLFGLINPEILGIKAFRHTYSPNISFSYNPDFSNQNYGFYNTFYNPLTQEFEKYSHYANEGGRHAPIDLSKTLSYSDLHSFEIKLPSKDTLPEKKIELLRLNFSTGYNFGVDSLQFAPIYMQFRSPALDFINFTGQAGFVLYDEEPNIDKTTGLTTNYTHFVNRYLISDGKGLMRLTNLSLSLSTSFSSEGIVSQNSFGRNLQNTHKDTLTPGERFSQRLNQTEESFDYYGDESPGYSPISIPWSFNIALTYSYSQPLINQISRNLNTIFNLSFSLTNTWKIQATTQYDFINNKIMAPYFSVSKDLHCWELLFTWSPSVYNGGFYLRFGIKAPELKDLKIEKRNSPLY